MSTGLNCSAALLSPKISSLSARTQKMNFLGKKFALHSWLIFGFLSEDLLQAQTEFD